MAAKGAKPSTNDSAAKKGRPRLLSEEVQDAIRNSIEAGIDPVVAAEMAGVSERTWYRWMERAKDDLAGGVEDSPEVVLFTAAKKALAGARGKVERCAFRGATEDPRHAFTWLERAHRQRWAREETQKIEHSGSIQIPVPVVNMPKKPDDDG